MDEANTQRLPKEQRLQTGFPRSKTYDGELFVCQIYVDDIIFGCTNQKYSDEFGHMMQEQYQMSMMGELKFFLGLQIRQQRNGIFISQEKYLKDCLKKFGMQAANVTRHQCQPKVIWVLTPMVKSSIKRYTAP